MTILPIPAEKRDRDDRTRLMVPFEDPPFSFTILRPGRIHFCYRS